MLKHVSTLLLAALFAVACKGSENPGKGKDGGDNADGGSGISVTVSIVGEGEVDVNGSSVCSSDNDPCHLSVTLGGTTSVTAVPATGYQFASWNCQGMVSTNATLDLQLASGVSCTVTFTKVSESLMVTATDGKGGTGGVVTSSVGGVSCGTNATTCSAALDYGTMVTLTATPDANYTFAGWSGDCAGTDPSVTLMVDGPTSCVATFSRVQYPLTLSVVGQGTLGAATAANPTLASCTGSNCMVEVDAPSVVTLTAQAGANYRIGSWAGDCVADASSNVTTVTMDMPRSCVVTFVLVDRGLVVTTSGNGTGTVTRDPDLSTYTDGTAVTLTAAPDVNSDFGGWSGDCSGSDLSTMVTVTGGDKTCDAKFTKKKRTLTVVVNGPGTVVSAPAGIDSAVPTLSAQFDHGTAVGLTAVPALHYETTFTGDCTGVGNAGSVTMDADKACTVSFTKVKQTLNVTVVGSGSVTSAPAGIDTKTGAANAPYDWGTTVTLTATPNVGGQQISFVGWTGDCTPDGVDPKKATVTLDADRSCTASFTITPYNLTVSVAPTGGGAVTGKIGGTGVNVIDCKSDNTGDCTENAIPSDKTVTLIAAAAAGYRFDKWSNCDTDTTATLIVPLNSDKTCVANFVKTYVVTFSANTGGTVSASCGTSPCTVDAGTKVTLTGNASGTPAPGYRWKSWSAGGGACGFTTNGQQVTINSDQNCVSNFDALGTVAVTDGAGGTSATVASANPSPDNCAAGASCTVKAGLSVSLVATPANGYRFNAWTGAGCAVGNANSATTTATVPSLSTMTCNATYTRQYLVTFSNGTGGSSITSSCGASPCTVDTGTNVTLTGNASGTPAPGYRWKSWTAGGGGACSFATNGQTVSIASDQNCVSNYDALGTVAVTNGTGGTSATVASANPAPDACAAGASCTAKSGLTVDLVASPSAGYRFNSWTGAGCTVASATNATTTATVPSLSTMTCNATYTRQYTVTFSNATGGSSITASCGASPCTVDSGTSVTLTGTPSGTPAPGYRFKSWTAGGGGACSFSSNGQSVSVTSDQNCVANYDALGTVTVVNGTGGTSATVASSNPAPDACVAGASCTIKVGLSVSLVATPTAGYRFDSWTGAGCTVGNSTSATTTATVPALSTMTCTATYIRQYTVTFSNGTGGSSITASCGASPCTVDTGTSVTLTGTASGTPAPGYRFKSWTAGGGGACGFSSNGQSISVTSDQNCVANYDALGTVAVVNGTGGMSTTVSSANAAPDDCVAGASCTIKATLGVSLVATPSAGYRFNSWTGAGCTVGNSTSASTTATVPSLSTMTCTATYTRQYVVTFSNGTGGSSITSSCGASPCTVDTNTSVTLTGNASATPAPGYRWKSWTAGVGGACSFATNGQTVSIASDQNCVANYDPLGTVAVVNGAGGSSTTVSSANPAPDGCVAGASCTIKAGLTANLSASPAGGYRFGSWSGCTVANASSATTTTTVPSLSTSTCTANYIRQYTVTVRVAPAPSSTNYFGTVSAPCTITSAGSTCSTIVDTGSTATLTAAVAKTSGGQDASHFVKWICSNGATDTATSTSTVISGNTTCVAQFYGLWSRYYQTANTKGHIDAFDVGAALPIATSGVDGLPTSSSSFLIDGADLGNGTQSYSQLAMDDLGKSLGFGELAKPSGQGQAALATAMVYAGGDVATSVGEFVPASGRLRGSFWPFDVSRDGTTGLINGDSRLPLSEIYYNDLSATARWDEYFLAGDFSSSQSAYALGGLRTLSTYNVDNTLTGVIRLGWLVKTDKNGVPQTAESTLVPATYDGGTCGNGQASNATQVNDVMWDPDPSNPGGVVAVGQYQSFAGCQPATTPCGPTYAFIVKYDASWKMLALRTMAPSGQSDFTATRVVQNLAGNGYAVFGNFGGTMIGIANNSYSLAANPLIQRGLAITDSKGTPVTTTLADVAVDRPNKNYVVVGTANSDAVILLVANDGSINKVFEYGSTLGEAGYRIVQPPDGGWLLMGYGQSGGANNTFAYWLTRMDDNFFVPFNGHAGNPPVDVLTNPTATNTGDLKLTGQVMACTNSWGIIDTPLESTADFTSTPVTPLYDVEAP